MPVRIVKDAVDERSLNDVVNQNVRGNSSQGGGFDISTIANILGTLGSLTGGGGNTEQRRQPSTGGLGGLVDAFIGQSTTNTGGLGGLFNTLIGGNQQPQQPQTNNTHSGSGLGTLFNVIGQMNSGGNTQPSGGGIGNLGNLVSMFLNSNTNTNRTQPQNNNPQGNAVNPLVAAFVSMAIQTCMRYAMNQFFNQQKNRNTGFAMGTSAPGNPDFNQAEQILQHRLASAKICVSLWNYACGADHQFQDSEKQAIQMLIEQQVKFLFPENIARQDDVLNELQQTFLQPLPAEKIVEAARADMQFAGDLYGQACMLIAVDKSLQQSESQFLDKLASDFGLSPQTAQEIRKQFGL